MGSRSDDRPDRRQFLFGVAALVGGGAGLAAFRMNGGPAARQRSARLRARPGPPGSSRLAGGRQELPAAAGPGAFVYVPESAAAGAAPAPLIVFLHGAGRSLPGTDRMIAEADRRHFVLAVPRADEHTWDLMALGRYAGDSGHIDAALEAVFGGVAIDPDRICLAGFSDGASYALSVGLQNGDLFTHLIAFSPGFIGPGRALGAPRVFVSHGRADRVLPIERTSARIVASLETRGLEHRYREFDGGHEMPDAIRTAALDWFLA